MGKAPHDNPAEHEAAAWVLRVDRGLTPAEQDRFSEWLAADPRHGEQLARHRHHWQRLDALGQWLPEHSERPNPDLLAPPPHRPVRWLPVTLMLAAAAGIVVAFSLWRPMEDREPSPPVSVRLAAVSPADPGSQSLPDGTIVECNRGAKFSVHFTAAERRVNLEHGEAYFTVTKDPARPFIVTAGRIDVRAVGTAFNVRLDAAAVEVLVTAGRVRLDSAAPKTPEPSKGVATPSAPVPADRLRSPERTGATTELAHLEARQRAVVSIAADARPPEVATLTAVEIERVLAWQKRLLNFTATPLQDIVAEFNRQNVIQLVLVDSDLASVRISASFRSDNIEGFVSLLQAGFGVRAERRGAAEILLRRTAAPQGEP